MDLLLTDGDVKGFETQVNEAMQAPIKHFEKELVAIRTGRASTKLVENLQVECYGQLMKLIELAGIAAPDARLITIQPWDKSTINAIEKAIQNSDLGITPMNDGDIIRLQIPQMTSARREELVKILGKKTEEARVHVRNVRRDALNEIKAAHKDNLISEDFLKRLEDSLQKVTDKNIAFVNTLSDKKAEDIRQI